MDRRAVGILAFALLGGCAGSQSTVVIDGSSTAFPFVNLMAEDFGNAHSEIRMVANKSGTGSGLARLARGEIDVATASRRVEPQEVARTGEPLIEIPIARDGVTVVVNRANPLTELTLSQLRAAWVEGRTNEWRELGSPLGRIAFYGPTENHGTHEVFAGALGTTELRNDVQQSQDYNVVVRAVGEDRNGIGYVGLDYYDQNRDRLKALAVDGVLPTSATVSDGSYRALSRPLYLYVRRRSLARPEIMAFLRFALGSEGRADVMEADYAPLPPSQIAETLRRLEAAR